jgi:hypothetical protein
MIMIKTIIKKNYFICTNTHPLSHLRVTFIVTKLFGKKMQRIFMRNSFTPKIIIRTNMIKKLHN